MPIERFGRPSSSASSPWRISRDAFRLMFEDCKARARGVLGATVTFFFGSSQVHECQEAGPLPEPGLPLCDPPSLLSFGGSLLRLFRRLEDVLVDEAGHGAAQHAERVPAEVRPLVRDQRR